MSTPLYQSLNANYSPAPSLEVRSSAVSLQVYFKDSVETPVAVSTPLARFRFAEDTNGDEPVTPEALTGGPNPDGTYPMDPVLSNLVPIPGLYQITFLTNAMRAGLYNVYFTGFNPLDNNRSLLVRGQFGLGELSRVQDYINRTRQGLMDDHPEDYRLDEPVKQWTAQQLFSYARDVVDRINMTGPRITDYILESFPPGLDELVITGMKIWALYARSRLEKANEMNYSDQHTLNISRADFYKNLADALYRDWLAAIIAFKKATPPTPMGIRSQRLPFRVFRVLGLLPNSQSIFSG